MTETSRSKGKTLVRLAEDEIIRVEQAIADGKLITGLQGVKYMWKWMAALARKVERLEQNNK